MKSSPLTIVDFVRVGEVRPRWQSRLDLAATGSFIDTNADSPYLPQRGLADTGYRHEPWYVEPLRPDKDSHPVGGPTFKGPTLESRALKV